MAKLKYYYDEDSMSFKQLKHGKLAFIKRTLIMGASTIMLMFIGFLVFTPVYESPTEKKLKRELEYVKINEDMHMKKIEQISNVLLDIQDRDNNIYRSYFETSTIPIEQRLAGFGGVNRYRPLEGYENSDVVINVTRKLDILSKQIYVQSTSLDEIVELAMQKEKLLASMPAIQPIKNEDLTRMASGYGSRKDPYTKIWKMHWGMDFTAPTGTPVYASGDGLIIRADQKSSGYGKHVRIDHGFGFISLYAHLSKYNVFKNQRVKRGDIIGYVGSTGRSKGPHLHYEVHKKGTKINPLNFYYGNLSPLEFASIEAAARIKGESYD